jgi:DNA polymerase-4
MERIILHIDFDSFFASVAQQVNPLFRNRPIGVTATNGRNCIIAASREAKALGIKSPSRTYDALRICPSIVFVPADFNLYWEVSKKFIDICKDYTPYVEIFSLDEVFMDITQSAYLFGGAMGVIEKIRARLIEEVGEYITVSVGISNNKLLSKLASGLKKPCGLVEIKATDVSEVYKTTKLTDICGIGGRIESRLNQMGIYTLTQLSTAPKSALIAEFGNVEGNFLYNVGQGEDDRGVVPYTEAPEVKSAGRNYCLPENEYDMRKVYQNIYELCEEVSLKLRRLNKKARGVGFYLRGDVSIGGHHTTDQYMNTGAELFRIFTRMFDFNEQEYVRQISVWTYHLEDEDKVPSLLFPKYQRMQKLTRVMDQINERFGDHTIRNGFLLYADKLTTVPNGYMADRFMRTDFAEQEKTRLTNLID